MARVPALVLRWLEVQLEEHLRQSAPHSSLVWLRVSVRLAQLLRLE
jgi:hypothetical protein